MFAGGRRRGPGDPGPGDRRQSHVVCAVDTVDGVGVGLGIFVL